MNYKLLKLKELTPTQKLIIMLVLDYPQIIPFDMTSQEIANEIGLPRKVVLNELWVLEEMDFITCKVSYRSRKISITKRLKDLI